MFISLIFVICWALSSSQYCQLYPTNATKKDLIFCNGPFIKSFPQYSASTVEFVTTIILKNTEINCFFHTE